jgi:hypothetical protein
MIKRPALAGAFIVAMAAGYATPAAAQATRTWVSGVGDDANPCSRTAPCKTFAGAISKTAAGGEINCLDSGGFGSVTITKSLTIICDGVIGGVLASGTSGIVVNAQPTDTVFLSGLEIHGGGTGINGIRFVAGGSLHVQNTTIQRFNGTNGTGISFAPSGSSQLTVTNTAIVKNGTAGTGGGVVILPGASGATFNNVRIQNNAQIGIRADSTTGGAVRATLSRSEISGNENGVSAVSPPGMPLVQMAVIDSLSVYNTGYGIGANGALAQVRVSDSLIKGNATGLIVGGSANIVSYGDNVLFGNTTTDGTFSATVTKQ